MFASAMQAHTDPHTTVFSQGQNNHTPSPRYAAIHALQLHSIAYISILACEDEAFLATITEQDD